METLIGSKPALASSGIWGGLIAFSVGLIEIASQLITDPTVLAFIPVQYLPVVGVIGSVVAIYGRANADTKIKGIVSTK